MFDGITKTFAGWYDNEALEGSPFDFSGSMPALEAVKQSGDKSTLVLYAKWKTAEFTVTFDLDGGTIDESISIEPETVEAGGTVTQPAGTMKKDGYRFGGWETPDGRLFSFDTEITKDTALKAIWHAEGEEDIRISYDAGDKGDFTAVDPRRYHRNAEARVIGIPKVKTEYRNAGWYFRGWKVGNTDTLVSKGTFVVIDPEAVRGSGKVLRLTAVYEKRETETFVTYNSNLPDGSSESFTDEQLAINGNYEVRSFESTGMTGAGEGYEFVCWRNDSEHRFMAGETAAAGSDGEQLYAVWKVKEIVPDDPEPDPDPKPEPKPEPEPDKPSDGKKSDVLGDFEDESDNGGADIRTSDSGSSTGLGNVITGDRSQLMTLYVIFMTASTILIILLGRKREDEE